MFSIKICGIRTLGEEQLVARSGGDAVGLNFHAESKRYLDDVARSEFESCESVGPLRVGVFVDQEQDVILANYERYHLGAVQLHGDETPELVADLSKLHVIKAFPCRAGIEAQVMTYVDRCERSGGTLAAVLIDAAGNGSFGGTGEMADWTLVRRIRDQLQIPTILAGGLNPENVRAAVRQTLVEGVDVASGVERGGYKDRELVHNFVSAARVGLDEAKLRKNN